MKNSLLLIILVTITACQAQNQASPTQDAETNAKQTPEQAIAPANNANAAMTSQTQRDPFQRQSTPKTANSHGLTAFPLNKLVTAGYLQDQHRYWVIINAPDQRSYPVTIGSNIGNQGDQVIAISHDKFTLNNPKKNTTITLPLFNNAMINQGEINP